jgi:hypothetical protein
VVVLKIMQNIKAFNNSPEYCYKLFFSFVGERRVQTRLINLPELDDSAFAMVHIPLFSGCLN